MNYDPHFRSDGVLIRVTTSLHELGKGRQHLFVVQMRNSFRGQGNGTI